VLYDREALMRRQREEAKRRGALRWNPVRRPAPRRRRNPEDKAFIRDLVARLQDYKDNVVEEAGGDPDREFDPNDYPIYKGDIADYLGVPVLGWGATRVVAVLPSGNVVKLPWSDTGAESSDREWENWNEASEEVQELLLPPLEYVAGAIVFPRVKTVTDRDYDDPELDAARKAYARLYRSNAPGANAQDFQNTQNWGVYDGRLVLLDYGD